MGETPSASSAQPFRIKHTITLQSLLLSRSGRFIGVIRISVIAFFTPTSPILEQDAITLNYTIYKFDNIQQTLFRFHVLLTTGPPLLGNYLNQLTA